MRRRTFLEGFAAATAAAAGPLIVTDRTTAQTRTIFVNTSRRTCFGPIAKDWWSLAYCAPSAPIWPTARTSFRTGGRRTGPISGTWKKFPGNRSMLHNAVRAAQFALVADGVSPDKIFPMDVDRAFKKLDTAAPRRAGIPRCRTSS